MRANLNRIQRAVVLGLAVVFARDDRAADTRICFILHHKFLLSLGFPPSLPGEGENMRAFYRWAPCLLLGKFSYFPIKFLDWLTVLALPDASLQVSCGHRRVHTIATKTI